MTNKPKHTEDHIVDRMDTAKKKEVFLQALEKSLGIVKTACDQLGISRQTYYNWMQKDPEFKARALDAKEIALDFAESQLFKQIQSGNAASTIFYLKTQGRDRGYQERIEHTGADGGDMTIAFKIIAPDGSEKNIQPDGSEQKQIEQ